MTERKPTKFNDNLVIQTNNSYDITYGLKITVRKMCGVNR